MPCHDLRADINNPSVFDIRAFIIEMFALLNSCKQHEDTRSVVPWRYSLRVELEFMLHLYDQRRHNRNIYVKGNFNWHSLRYINTCMYKRRAWTSAYTAYNCGM